MTKITLDQETADRLGIKRTVRVLGGLAAFGRPGSGTAYVTYKLLDGREVTTHDEPSPPSDMEALDKYVSRARAAYAISQIEYWQVRDGEPSLQDQALNGWSNKPYESITGMDVALLQEANIGSVGLCSAKTKTDKGTCEPFTTCTYAAQRAG